MADQDLTLLDETKPNGDTEEVAVLDEYQRETRRKLKAWAAVEHDPITGTHIIPHGSLPGIPPNGKLSYHDDQRELLISSGGAWRSTLQPTFNYVINGMFNQFTSFPTVTFPGWGLGGNAPTMIHQNNGVYSTDNVRLRAVVDFATLGQNVANNASLAAPFSPYTYWRDKTVTFGAFIRTTGVNGAYIRIYDGLTLTNSPFALSDNVWRWITVTKRIAPGTSLFRIELVTTAIGANAFFCGATLVEGHSCPHPLPPSWQGRQGTLRFGHSDIQPNTNTPWWYGTGGHGTAAAAVQTFLPFDALARNFYVNAVADVGAGTLTAQIEHSGVLTPLLVTLTSGMNEGSYVTDGYVGLKTGGWSAKVTRNGGFGNAFFSSLTFDEVPSLP
jgi:hypothetical protein